MDKNGQDRPLNLAVLGTEKKTQRYCVEMPARRRLIANPLTVAETVMEDERHIQQQGWPLHLL